MKDRAPTYQEVLAAARLAAQEIERDWPRWKQALSVPDQTPKPNEAEVAAGGQPPSSET